MSSLTAGARESVNRTQPTLKLSHLFDGLTVSRNFKLLFFVSAFFAWLFVIYWVRHHEPMLHEVMGRGVMHSTTADADREIVSRVKGAFPMKTSPASGEIYQPDVSVTDNNFGSPVAQQSNQSQNQSGRANQPYAYASVGPGQAISAPGQAISAPSLAQAKFGLPRGYVLNGNNSNKSNMAEPILPNSSSTSLPAQTAAASYGNPICTLSHYYVPIHSANGTYLKTIANR